MKHSPLIRLDAAKRRYRFAEQACPHWDFESDGCQEECCAEVQSALEELSLARRAVERAA